MRPLSVIPLLVGAMLFSGTSSRAEKPIHPETPALSPEDGLKSIHVPDGYEVELVVAEPLVMDPTAIAWGSDGRLWVAEMTDYPLGLDNEGKVGGRIRWLADTTGDGRYDKSVVFAEGLAFPNSVLPWRDGVLVTCAPEILYLEDDDGDGVSEKRTALVTGFDPANQQLRVNGLRWGLDNWIHCASGSPSARKGLNANITSTITGEKLDLGSRDFRFRPDTGEMEATSGPTQFGKNRDDWDNWFGCMNSYPLWHYVLEDRYLGRNPHIAAPSPIEQLVLPRNPKIYPAKAPQKRFHSFQHSGHYTSACSAMIYRDELLFPPANYHENALHSFTCEPFHNLVQHNIIDNNPEGFSFSQSYRDPNERDLDFFASEDRWCRPVMARTGPDGALWVVDMYRYIIEHTQFLTPEAKEEFGGEYRRGHDRGRIYRVFPKGKKPLMPPVLDNMSNLDRIAALDTTNGWVRDAIQRHTDIVEPDPATFQPLRDLIYQSKNPRARASALAITTAHGIFGAPEYLYPVLKDAHAGVRREGLRAVEFYYRAVSKKQPNLFADEILLLRSDPDAQVRLQFACTIGYWPAEIAGPAIGKMAATDPLAGDKFLQAALLSSVNEANIGFVMTALLAEPEQNNSGPFTGELLALAVAFGDQNATIDGLARILDHPATGNALQRQFDILAGLLDALERKRTTLEEMVRTAASEDRASTVLEHVETFRKLARQTAADAKSQPALRIAAIQLLARSEKKDQLTFETDLLFTQLAPAAPASIQAAIVTQLGRQADPAIAERVLANWRSYPPAAHAATFDVLLTRKEWMPAFFAAVEKGTVVQADVDLNSRQRLLVYPDTEIRKQLTELLADSTSPDRRQVIADHQPVLKLTGDTERGKLAFAKACVACHRLGGQGVEIGPNLVSITDKSPASLLSSILDPSASVDARYFTYIATTKDERTLMGIVAGETAVNITLHDQANQKHVLLRGDLDSLQSTGRSLMPDGIEAALNHQELADLIAYVRAAE